MLTRIRTSLTYANVVATLALFLALGGSAVAIKKIKSKNIATNAVKAKHIAPNSVLSSEIANNAVDGASIAGGAVGSTDLAEAIRPRRLDYSAAESASGSAVGLVDMGELELFASCTNTGSGGADRTHVHFLLRPTVPAIADTGGVIKLGPASAIPGQIDNVPLPANTLTDVLDSSTDTDGDRMVADFTYVYRSSGRTMAIVVHAEADDAAGTTGGVCNLRGVAIPAS